MVTLEEMFVKVDVPGATAVGDYDWAAQVRQRTGSNPAAMGTIPSSNPYSTPAIGGAKSDWERDH